MTPIPWDRCLRPSITTAIRYLWSRTAPGLLATLAWLQISSLSNSSSCSSSSQRKRLARHHCLCAPRWQLFKVHWHPLFPCLVVATAFVDHSHWFNRRHLLTTIVAFHHLQWLQQAIAYKTMQMTIITTLYCPPHQMTCWRKPLFQQI